VDLSIIEARTSLYYQILVLWLEAIVILVLSLLLYFKKNINNLKTMNMLSFHIKVLLAKRFADSMDYQGIKRLNQMWNYVNSTYY